MHNTMNRGQKLTIRLPCTCRAKITRAAVFGALCLLLCLYHLSMGNRCTMRVPQLRMLRCSWGMDALRGNFGVLSTLPWLRTALLGTRDQTAVVV